MTYKELKKGYRIEYTFIEGEQLKYAQTQVYISTDALNTRLAELDESHSIQSAIVVSVRFFDKSIV